MKFGGRAIARIFLAIAILSFAPAIATAAVAVPAAYMGPSRIDLSGVWNFRLDANSEGEAAHWFATDTPQGWGQLAVPGSFNEQLAKNPGAPDKNDPIRFYAGKAWYRTTFATPIPQSSGSNLCILHLSGTVLRHKVWLNGEFVGESRQPYLDAAYDITKLLKAGRNNSLVVEVDNTIEQRAIPDAKWRGWWDDGGLIRPVYLEIRPEVHSQSYVTTTMQPDGGWKLGINTEVNQGSASGRTIVSYTLADATGKSVWRSADQTVQSSQSKAAVTISASLHQVHPWSPEHPNLYVLTTTTRHGKQIDRISTHIGFRQIEVRGTEIVLNGNPITIRGISRHQFLAGAGMSLSPAQDRKDMEDIKALGANFVRLAHYTQSQDVFDACDELGLLVWTEMPAWQSSIETLSDPKVWSDYAQPQLKEIVAEHRNHPSVIVWSVANEIPTNKQEGAAYIAKAVAYVKSQDSSRLVSFASNKRDKDLAFGSVDIISVNEYYGWYYGSQDGVGPMLDKLHRLHPDKPILVTEFGTEAVANWDPATAVKGSRNYSYAAQTSFLETHLKQIYAPERRSYVAGGVVWLYNDYPDPHRIGGDHPNIAIYRNNKGLVTMDRVHKPAFEAVQKFYTALKTETAQ